MKTWKLISSIDSILNFLWWANIVCIPFFVIIQSNSFNKDGYIKFEILVDHSKHVERKTFYPETFEVVRISIVPETSTIEVDTPKSWKYHVFYWIYNGIGIFISMFSLFYLRKLFGNFTNEDYFSHKNSLYLKYIAFVVASGSLFTWLSQFIGKKLLSEYVPSQAGSISWGFWDGVFYLVLGLVIYILADIFKQAADVEEKKEQLQTENEGFI